MRGAIGKIHFQQATTRGRMIPEKLEELVIKHKEQGHLPFFLNCTTGARHQTRPWSSYTVGRKSSWVVGAKRLLQSILFNSRAPSAFTPWNTYCYTKKNIIAKTHLILLFFWAWSVLYNCFFVTLVRKARFPCLWCYVFPFLYTLISLCIHILYR